MNKINKVIENLPQSQKDEKEFLDKNFTTICSEDTNIVRLSLSYFDNKEKDLTYRSVFDYDIYYSPKRLVRSRFYQKKGSFINSEEHSRRSRTKYRDEQITILYPLDNIVNNTIKIDSNQTIITHEEEGVRKIIYEEPFISYRIILYREQKPALKIKLLVEVPLNYKNEVWCWEKNKNIKKTIL